MMEDQMVNCRTILCSQGDDNHFFSSRKWSTPIWNKLIGLPPQKEIWNEQLDKYTCIYFQQKHKLHSAGGNLKARKWEIRLEQLAPAKVAFCRRMKMECKRQDQWLKKKVELEHVASCDVDQSNEHPLGHVLSKFLALEEWKEKFPAYRGSVVPTHFQEWVGEPD